MSLNAVLEVRQTPMYHTKGVKVEGLGDHSGHETERLEVLLETLGA